MKLDHKVCGKSCLLWLCWRLAAGALKKNYIIISSGSPNLLTTRQRQLVRTWSPWEENLHHQKKRSRLSKLSVHHTTWYTVFPIVLQHWIIVCQIKQFQSATVKCSCTWREGRRTSQDLFAVFAFLFCLLLQLVLLVLCAVWNPQEVKREGETAQRKYWIRWKVESCLNLAIIWSLDAPKQSQSTVEHKSAFPVVAPKKLQTTSWMKQSSVLPPS